MELTPVVIVLAGATSAGKSTVAMKLCEKIGGEIVVADSVQVYKYLDIGSNKPTTQDRSKVPHHLVDIVDKNNILSTGDYVIHCVDRIKDILNRGKNPIIVGGATMWIQWLVYGTPDAPKASEEIKTLAQNLLEKYVKENYWDEAVTFVEKYDPIRTKKLEKNDWYRLHRFLEIGLSINQSHNSSKSIDPMQITKNEFTVSLTGERQSLLSDVDIRCFFLTEERETLYEKIDNRCEVMLNNGLMEEVVELLINDQLPLSHPATRAIGYRQTIAYLCKPSSIPDQPTKSSEEILSKLGTLSYRNYEFEEFLTFIADFASATRNYAKRQMNWFRKDEKFLFLRMKRLNTKSSSSSSESNKKLPFESQYDIRTSTSQGYGESSLDVYDKAADEILHWSFHTTMPTFDMEVKQQIDIMKLNHLQSNKKQTKKRKQPLNLSSNDAMPSEVSMDHVHIEESVRDLDLLNRNQLRTYQSIFETYRLNLTKLAVRKNYALIESIQPMTQRMCPLFFKAQELKKKLRLAKGDEFCSQFYHAMTSEIDQHDPNSGNTDGK